METKDDRRFHNLTQEQVETLHQVLTEVIPIHGRGNFPTLEIKPKDIIHVVRDRLVSKHIKVRDVRLNGSTASHVLVKENGTSYKDLDIIFGVELPKQEDFQIIKEVVLGCLLDFLPSGVNKDKITALTMKEAYVQKMVKVFTEHDRWSLISLCNNSGKNVELKFVSSLRRQFEFSVDSFQIILDTILESYLKAERQEAVKKLQEASAVLKEQIVSADTQSGKKTDINMSDRTVSYEPEGHCGNDGEITQERRDDASTEDTATETVQKEQSEELTVSGTSPAPVESLLELFDDRTDQNNAEQNTVETGGIHLEGEATSKPVPVPDAEAHSLTEGDPESIFTLRLAEPEPEHTSQTPELVQSTETKPEPMILTDQCTFQPTPDSIHEFASPPPAKKTSWTSQMVVLKHSSPKPPRKMSRKVTCPSKERKDAKESTPMQVESPGLTTIQSHDEESSVGTLDVSTTIASEEENTTSSEEMLSVLPAPEKTHLQTPEPETGETTNSSVLSPLSETLNILMDIETETKTEMEKPIIQINSQPLPESEEAVCSGLSSKDEPQLVRPQECLDLDSPQTAPCVVDSKIPDRGFGLPGCTVPLILAQEPPVPQSPPGEPSPLLEPPVLLVPTDDFPKITSRLLENIQHCAWPSESSTFTPQPVPTLPDVCPAMPTVEPSAESSQLESPPAPPSQGQPEAPAESPDLPEFERRGQTRRPSEVPRVTVVAESMYGDFEQAMDHLRCRLIATRNPEEIRGGGLLKYSNLLVRDFRPASETEIKTLERYMCSRFFIDFPDVNEQQRKIESYLRNHFIGEEKSKYDYLMTLRRVVNESTVCLMGHERRQTLNMITILALKVLGEQNIIPNTNNVTCYYQPAPYMTAEHNFSNYYITNGQSPLIYHPYPLHIHMQTGLV